MYILMHAIVANHDAIGNDIELMFNILSMDNECLVYSQLCLNKNVKCIDEAAFDEAIKDEGNVIIYHHSTYWKYGFDKLKGAKCKVVFKYHNITPEFFFEPYNTVSYYQCMKGRQQTVALQKEFPEAYWLCDSEYNASELEFVGKERIGICAPFNKIEKWGLEAPDKEVADEIKSDNKFSLLFVGRIAPNKGHKMILDVIKTYVESYDSDIKIRIIGKFDHSIPEYNYLIKGLIKEYGIEDNVEFIGEINDSKLVAYYRNSDVMLCCSDHEGFCVPAIEAQYFGLPLVALSCCALPETAGKDQFMLDRDIKKFAATLRLLKENGEVRDFVIKAAKENYDSRFTQAKIEEQFLKEISKA